MIQGVGVGIVSAVLDVNLLDEIIQVTFILCFLYNFDMLLSAFQCEYFYLVN